MWAPAQESVQKLLDALVASGRERGLQVAAYRDGDLVVDAWAGLADAASGRPVDGETLFVAFSATKGVTATAIHLLCDRGTLAYDRPIAHYWPAFGAHGKGAITLRQVLAHTAGVPHLPPRVTPADLADWDGMCAGIAALAPLWRPGTRTGYHAQSFGWILGEVARRADGRTIDRIVQDEICRPLGIRSLHLGLPEAAASRVATLEDAPPGPPARRSRAGAAARLALAWRERRVWRSVGGRLARAFGPSPHERLRRRAEPADIAPLAAVYNLPATRRAVLPASGGIMNARALARHYAALAGGELDGARLLTRGCLRLATELQTCGFDLVLGAPIRKGLGYWLGESGAPPGSSPTAFGHPGAGGTIGFADPAAKFAFALTKNRLTPGGGGETAALIAGELRAALGIAAGAPEPP